MGGRSRKSVYLSRRLGASCAASSSGCSCASCCKFIASGESSTSTNKRAAVRRVAGTLAADSGITHLIHNAGLIWPNLLEDASTEDIAGLAQLHLGSALQLMQAVLPQMKAANFGRVMFNSSRAALGVPTRTAYSATKAAIIGMARTWALELAPHGITVNVIAPGPIQTDNFWGIVEKGSDREAKLANSIPVGRLGTTADVVNAFLFFCDPETSFVTGQTLYVCGGASIGTLTI